MENKIKHKYIKLTSFIALLFLSLINIVEITSFLTTKFLKNITGLNFTLMFVLILLCLVIGTLLYYTLKNRKTNSFFIFYFVTYMFTIFYMLFHIGICISAAFGIDNEIFNIFFRINEYFILISLSLSFSCFALNLWKFGDMFYLTTLIFYLITFFIVVFDFKSFFEEHYLFWLLTDLTKIVSCITFVIVFVINYAKEKKTYLMLKIVSLGILIINPIISTTIDIFNHEGEFMIQILWTFNFIDLINCIYLLTLCFTFEILKKPFIIEEAREILHIKPTIKNKTNEKVSA